MSRCAFCRFDGIARSRKARSMSVNTTAGEVVGNWRRSMVSQDILQAAMQQSAMQLARRSAVVSRISSIRHPVFRVLKKVSIFRRRAYQPSLCTASAWLATGGLVISFQKMAGRSAGGVISQGNRLNVTA